MQVRQHRFAFHKRILLAVAVLFLLPCTTLLAQQRSSQSKPEELGGNDLLTRDGVQLSATFYPGKEDKETIPVLFLHDWKGSRADFQPLIDEFARYGFAVLAPDLRGHGESTTQLVANPRGKPKETEINAEKFRTPDFAAMKAADMGALRRFLVKKNNEGKLNLNQLVLIGAGTGANIAMEWAIYDWTIPNYPQAGIKQSKDVKGLVLFAPYWQAPGFNTPRAVAHPVLNQGLPVMILVGKEDPQSLDDGEKISKALKRNVDTSSATAETSRVWFGKFSSAEKGAKLLDDLGTDVTGPIHKFIGLKVLEGAKDAEWIEHH